MNPLDLLSNYLAANAFCPTGRGGGVDPHCGAGKAKAAKAPAGKAKAAKEEPAVAPAKVSAAVKARSANRPSLPSERVAGAAPKAKAWVDPPPKKASAKGIVKAGGKIPRPTGDDSQTAVGDLGELITRYLGFRSVLPKGKRNFTAEEVRKKGSSIDREYDHSGRLYEMKLCNTTSTEYRLKAKKEEKDNKLRYAKGVKAEAWTMVAVHDKKTKTIHVYGAKRPGFIGAEVSPKNFDYLGKVTYGG